MLLAGCGPRHAKVQAPERYSMANGYAYAKLPNGDYVIVTKKNDQKTRDRALQELHVGPSSVDELDMSIVTPLSKK